MVPASEAPVLAEGKTKKIIDFGGGQVLVRSKDDITAGDGAKHDVIAGKAALSTATTSNVFRLLKGVGILVAFDAQENETEFIAPKCRMLPFEVVVRREAHGSYLKRYPGATKGDVFSDLELEFFLKTSGKRWEEHELPKDDPLAIPEGDALLLFHPDLPFSSQEPFLVLEWEPILAAFVPATFSGMGRIARQTFLVLEEAWKSVGCKLVDFKVEFGVSGGMLLLADVIDNDSWRVVEGNDYIDKQAYRDGSDLNEVTAKYQRVREFTSQFPRFGEQNANYLRSLVASVES